VPAKSGSAGRLARTPACRPLRARRPCVSRGRFARQPRVKAAVPDDGPMSWTRCPIRPKHLWCDRRAAQCAHQRRVEGYRPRLGTSRTCPVHLDDTRHGPELQTQLDKDVIKGIEDYGNRLPMRVAPRG
jgi:hypothetical protein